MYFHALYLVTLRVQNALISAFTGGLLSMVRAALASPVYKLSLDTTPHPHATGGDALFFTPSTPFFYDSIRLCCLPLYDSPRARRVGEGLQPLSDSRLSSLVSLLSLLCPLTRLSLSSLVSRLSSLVSRLSSL